MDRHQDRSTMDDRRTAWAIFLSLIVMVMYYQLVFEPSMSEQRQAEYAQMQAAQQSATQPGAVPQQQAPTAGVTSPLGQQLAVPLAHPSKKELEESAKTIVTNGKVTISLSHLGARVFAYKLADYKVELGAQAELDLVDHLEGMSLPLGVYSGGVNDERVVYSLASVTPPPAAVPAPGSPLVVPSDSPLRVVLTGTLPNGTGITKTFTFDPVSYLFKLEVQLSAPPADGSQLWVEWPHFFPPESTNPRLQLTTLTFRGKDGGVSHVQVQKLADASSDYGENRWVAIADKYFMAALIPGSEGFNTRINREGAVVLGRVAGAAQQGSFNFYVGPKDYYILRSVNIDLYRAIDLGWFSFLAYPLLWLLRYFYSILSNYGLSIILLTLLVKTFMLPLSKASFTSMKAMQALQPELKALRERVQDPSQLNQEIMALYKRRGVNPLGGCLPAVIQIPVFLGLYNALLNAIELRHAPFALWVHDLSAPEQLPILGIPVPVMVLLMGVSLFLQQLTTPSTSLDPAQKAVMRLMPLIFTGMFIIFPMPAGLVLYWLTNNIISIVQQVYLRKEKSASPLSATVLAGGVIFAIGYILTLI